MAHFQCEAIEESQLSRCSAPVPSRGHKQLAGVCLSRRSLRLKNQTICHDKGHVSEKGRMGNGGRDSNTLHQPVGEKGRSLQIGNCENRDFTMRHLHTDSWLLQT